MLRSVDFSDACSFQRHKNEKKYSFLELIKMVSVLYCLLLEPHLEAGGMFIINELMSLHAVLSF